MTWTISYTATAKQQLRKLNKQTARQIIAYLEERVAEREDPRTLGKALTGALGGFWRYRVGDYRVICEVQGTALCILVLRLGNLKEVYR